MTARNDFRKGHIGDSLIVRKEEEASDKLQWLTTHPSPAFEFFLDQYVASRNEGFTPQEARQIANHLTNERFYNITHTQGYVSTTYTYM